MKPGHFLLNLVQITFLVVWSVIWMSSAILVVLVTFNRDISLAMARAIWARGLIWAARPRFTIDPLPDLDWEKPHIYVMNHQSTMDIACAFAAIPVNLRFIAKHTLKYVPFLGWYMWFTGMIFIDRSNRRQSFQSLAKAGDRIRSGANILAFPEGTRSRDGRILPLKKGIFIVALEAGVPIVPVAIEGTRHVYPIGLPRVNPGAIRVKIGTPIDTKGRPASDRDALMRETREALIRLHSELGGEAAHPQLATA